MPLLGILVDGEPVPLNQVPIEVLVPEVCAALAPDPSRHEEAIHLSTLGCCPYNVRMQRDLGYYLPPKSAYRMIRGKGWDFLMDRFPRTDAIYHPRYWRELGGVPITGEPDLIDLARHTIEDTKSPTWDNTKGTVYPSYAFQLNGYAWLTEGRLEYPEGETWEPTALYLNTMGPSIQNRIEVPLWPKSTRDREVSRRLDRLQKVLAEREPHLCSDPDCIFCKQECLYVPSVSLN